MRKLKVACRSNEDFLCRTLEGSILTFKFLSTLVVSHNRLADLETVLASLKKLPFLKHLGKTYLGSLPRQ